MASEGNNRRATFENDWFIVTRVCEHLDLFYDAGDEEYYAMNKVEAASVDYTVVENDDKVVIHCSVCGSYTWNTTGSDNDDDSEAERFSYIRDWLIGAVTHTSDT